MFIMELQSNTNSHFYKAVVRQDRTRQGVSSDRVAPGLMNGLTDGLLVIITPSTTLIKITLPR